MRIKIYVYIALILLGGGIAAWFFAKSDPAHLVRKPAAAPAPQAQTPAAAPAPPAAASAPAAEAEAAFQFSPKHGQSLSYRFALHSASLLDLNLLMATTSPGPAAPAEAEKTEIELAASGDLHLRYYDAPPGQWDVAAKIENPEFRLNGVEPAYAEALKTPFAFRMRATGFLSAFQFAAGMPKEAENILRQILYAMQLGLPEEPGARWATSELDATGRYRAEYESTSGPGQTVIKVTKRKLAYTALAAFPARPDMQMAVESSRHQFEVFRTEAWIRSVEAEEKSTSSSQNRKWGENAWLFSAHLVDTTPFAGFPDSFAGFLAALQASDYARKAYYATNSNLDRIGQGLSVEAALNKYRGILDAELDDPVGVAEAFLLNYLRQYPNACFDLIDLMNQNTGQVHLDDSTQLNLWRLIAKAGHSEAQQAVLNAALDPDFSRTTRIRALAYIHDFENPEAFVPRELLSFYDSAAADAHDNDTAELRTMTAYAVGSLGYAEKRNAAIKPEIARALTDRLQAADSTEEKAVLLTAIGNYGGKDALEAVDPYLSDPHPLLRASAYTALRRMRASEALETLKTHFQTETSAKVRKAALESFSEMPATDAAMAWARSEMLAAVRTGEQVQLAEVLGENIKTYPENERVLRQLLEKQIDNRVKKEIYRFIVP